MGWLPLLIVHETFETAFSPKFELFLYIVPFQLKASIDLDIIFNLTCMIWLVLDCLRLCSKLLPDSSLEFSLKSSQNCCPTRQWNFHSNHHMNGEHASHAFQTIQSFCWLCWHKCFCRHNYLCPAHKSDLMTWVYQNCALHCPHPHLQPILTGTMILSFGVYLSWSCALNFSRLGNLPWFPVNHDSDFLLSLYHDNSKCFVTTI